MTPTTGRTVLYRLTADDAEAINRRREHAKANIDKMREEKPGFQAHIGNSVSGGEVVPMVIVQVWNVEDGCLNGQATLDGNDSLWVCSAKEGNGPGEWHWPPRV